MAVPNVIGTYVRQGGVWERANAGTPEGFSGPQVRQGGTWHNALRVYGKASGVWQTCWVNIDREIELGNFLEDDLDVFNPPFFCRVDFWVNGDGTVDSDTENSTPNTRSEIGTWRDYDCGREYEIKLEEDTGPGFFAWTTHPPLDTWIALTDPSTDRQFGFESTSPGVRQAKMLVRIREKVSAPSGGNDSGNFTATCDNDAV